jgi:hypothetical protein
MVCSWRAASPRGWGGRRRPRPPRPCRCCSRLNKGGLHTLRDVYAWYRTSGPLPGCSASHCKPPRSPTHGCTRTYARLVPTVVRFPVVVVYTHVSISPRARTTVGPRRLSTCLSVHCTAFGSSLHREALLVHGQRARVLIPSPWVSGRAGFGRKKDGERGRERQNGGSTRSTSGKAREEEKSTKVCVCACACVCVCARVCACVSSPCRRMCVY